MKLIVHPAAQMEFDRKVDYLRENGLLPDAAELLVDEIENALEQVRRNPGASRMPNARSYYRVGPTERFGYSFVYQMSDDTIEVLAISAPQRRPGYWKRRKF
jgi:plasmid stabilization system protein ParE